MSEKGMRALLLEKCREEAQEMGITLQEYLLLCILDKMDDIPHT